MEKLITKIGESMLLVFYIFIGIIVILLLLILMIFCSKIELKINNAFMNNINKKQNNNNILVQISLKILNIRWLKIKLNKTKLENLYAKTKIKEIKSNIDMKKVNKQIKQIIFKALENKEIRRKILNIKIELENLNLKLDLATEDYILTSYLVAIISIIISNIVPHIVKRKNYKKIYYKISPVYQSRNLYQIKTDITLSLKIMQILIIAYKIFMLVKNKNQSENKVNIENIQKYNKNINSYSV
jgi:hypothetical protein